MNPAGCPWFWFGTALLLAQDGAAPASAQPKTRRVVLVGDSLAVGLAKPLGAELGARGVALQVRAATGANAGAFTEGSGAQSLGKLLADFRPDVVLVSLGTNDTVPGAEALAKKLPARFALLASRSSAAGARVVFLEPPALPWSREPIHQAAAHAQAALIVAPAIEQAPDRIHPTGAGYAAWSKFIASRKELSP